jgi:hypothetical protein
MAYVLVRHKVEDFAKWKPLYDGHATMRKKTALKDLYVFQDTNDPHNVFILFEAKDLAKAKEFTESADLRETMQKAGVIDRPDIWFLK